MKKIILLTISLSGMFFHTSPAQEFMMQTLQGTPQSNKINPAYMTDSKIFAGFPLTSSIMFGYQNNGFTYSDLIHKGSNDSLIWDIEGTIEKLNTTNSVRVTAENDLIWLGFNAGNNCFTINVTEKISGDITFSKNMMEFLYYGNGSYQGTSANINPGIDASHYREYGLTWSRQILSSISMGVRIKYLYGMEHIHSEGMGVNLYTDPNDFTLYGYSEYSLYTSGISSDSFDGLTAGEYLFKRNNTGWGADLGININAGKKFTVGLSVLDLGKINWKSNNLNYTTVTSDGPVIYQGLNLDEFINQGNSSEAFLENMLDSIYDGFNVQESYESFSSSLPTQIYTSVEYLTGKKGKTGLVLHWRETPSGSMISYNLHYTNSIKKWLDYSIGYSSINKSQGNIGAGVSVKFPGGHFYFASDNIIGLVNYRNANVTGFRAGINFVFNKSNKKPATPINELDSVDLTEQTPQ